MAQHCALRPRRRHTHRDIPDQGRGYRLPSPRSGLIYLKSDKGAVLETVLIVQTPVTFDATDLVFRVDPSQSLNTKGVILPIYAISGTITIDWGDGTEPQEITTMTTTATRYPSHIYSDKNRQYNVVVKGKVTNIKVIRHLISPVSPKSHSGARATPIPMWY